MSKFNICQKGEKKNEICTKKKVHIFNVWTTILQILNIE